MPRTSKGKRKSEVVPAVGIVGLSLSMAGGASAAAALPVGDLSAQEVALRPEVSAGLQLHEEEIADVSLATFYLFDKEEASTTQGRERPTRGLARLPLRGLARVPRVLALARLPRVRRLPRVPRVRCGGCRC